MFKNLYCSPLLEAQPGNEYFYKLEEVVDYVTSPEYISICEENYEYAKKVPGIHNHYLDN